MLITCPKCSAKYEIPSEVHLTAGKKLKCSNCQYVFTLREEMVEPEEKEVIHSSSVEEQVPMVKQDSAEVETVFSDDAVFKDDVPQPFVPVDTKENRSPKAVGVLGLIISITLLVLVCVFGFLYRDLLFDYRYAPVVSVKNTLTADKLQKMPLQKKEEKRIERYEESKPHVVSLPEIQSVHFEKRSDPVPTIRIEGILKNKTMKTLTLPEKVRAVAYNVQGDILFEKEIYLTDLVLPAGEERSFFGSYQPAPENVQWVDVTF